MEVIYKRANEDMKKDIRNKNEIFRIKKANHSYWNKTFLDTCALFQKLGNITAVVSDRISNCVIKTASLFKVLSTHIDCIHVDLSYSLKKRSAALKNTSNLTAIFVVGEWKTEKVIGIDSLYFSQSNLAFVFQLL